MRIPIEPAWHDNDGSGWEGNLFMSKNNTDNAWQTPSVWSHTYVGRYDGDILSTQDDIVASSFELKRNYPNPFNPTTQIKFDLAEDGLVTIKIYDVMGRQLKTLVNSVKTAGYHSIQWDATNDLGEGVSAGMYIYMIQAGDFVSTKKMVLLK